MKEIAMKKIVEKFEELRTMDKDWIHNLGKDKTITARFYILYGMAVAYESVGAIVLDDFNQLIPKYAVTMEEA